MDFDCYMDELFKVLYTPTRSLPPCSNPPHPLTLFCNNCTCIIFCSKQNNSSQTNNRFRQSKLANLPPQALKHLWIRTALMEKLLDKIVLFLVENSRYGQWTWTENRPVGKFPRLVRCLRYGFDVCLLFCTLWLPAVPFMRRKPCWWTRWMGPFLRPCWVFIVVWELSSHLKKSIVLYIPALTLCSWVTVGPCALEYTKVKTADHFWTDPSADELVQRHRIHSSHCRQDSPSRRPALVGRRGIFTWLQLGQNKPHLRLHEACTCPRSRSGSPAAAWTTVHWCGSKTTWNPSTKTQEPHSFLERTMCWCSRCVSAVC